MDINTMIEFEFKYKGRIWIQMQRYIMEINTIKYEYKYNNRIWIQIQGRIWI